jgi:multidrug efflux system membrane fusion protein
MKAEFPNAGRALWPGQFVNVRLLAETLKQVVVVPTAAVQRGPNGTFVYVVRDDSTVSVRTVKVDHQGESRTVVLSGVTPPERVVTTGFARLTDGAHVSISAPGAPERSADAGRPRRQGTDGAGDPPSQRQRGHHRRSRPESQPRQAP